jgi:hypothetical protein
MITATVSIEYDVDVTQADGTIVKGKRVLPIAVSGETEDEFESAIKVLKRQFADLIPTA